MNHACGTMSTDLLSAYVDDELDNRELFEVKSHLADCSRCRYRLESLARVSGALRNLERVAPPPALEEMVLGRLEVPSVRSWSRRLDDFMENQQRTRSTVGPVFALVMMLVLLVFLFTDAVVRKEQQPVVISVPSVELGPGSSSTTILVASGREFARMATANDEPMVESPQSTTTEQTAGPEPTAGPEQKGWADLATRLGTTELWVELPQSGGNNRSADTLVAVSSIRADTCESAESAVSSSIGEELGLELAAGRAVVLVLESSNWRCLRL